MSRQGKIRLAKWYAPHLQKEKGKITRELSQLVLKRTPKQCNVIEWRDKKLLYRRYASLFFVVGVDTEDNELITLEIIHLYVEALDVYFGNVCELDLIYNFQKAYFMLDEILIGGEQQEVGKRIVCREIQGQDELVDENESVIANVINPILHSAGLTWNRIWMNCSLGTWTVTLVKPSKRPFRVDVPRHDQKQEQGLSKRRWEDIFSRIQWQIYCASVHHETGRAGSLIGW